MKKILLLFPALLCLASCGEKICRETVETDNLTCEVTVYNPEIIRVVKYPRNGRNLEAKESYSVVLKPAPTRVSRKESAEKLTLTTSEIRCTVDKITGQVCFRDARTDELLLQESATSITPRSSDDVDAEKFVVCQRWSIPREEFLYGMGQRQDEDLSIRGKKIHLWNENMFIYIPFFCSEKGYGIYWDNPGMSDFDDTGTETSMQSEVGLGTDLYFLYGGGSMDRLTAAERALGGKATLFPLWVHGYWQSRERYHSTEELCEALATHRQMGIPLDGIVQDWQYWGPNTNWNSMHFDNPLYARADTMIDYVHRNNVHLVISIWPDFGPETPQYQELDSIGALLPFKTWPLEGGVKVYDPFNARAREIYWKHLKGLVEKGVDALWSDSTEPDHFDETKEDDDYLTADGSWRSVKNAFPLVTNQGIYDQYRAQGYLKRAVQMTRSASFGIQRYATFSWSGDVSSTWEVLRKQISSGLDYTLCGIPYWNTDIGGFFNWWYEGGTHNPALQELQVRWMQWSVFVPIMRNHTSGPLATEIYRFGNPGEWAYDQQLQAIRLRYRLLPYVYSLAGMTVQEDGMLMRPLVMDFRHDRKALALSDEYMFGPAFLVHPITTPVLSEEYAPGKARLTGVGSASFPTYLPSGTGWFDFHTGTFHEGGAIVQRAYSIEEIPVFVRAGSILPLGPDVQYSSEKAWDALEIAIYPGADGSFTLYEDAGDGYGYEAGEFSTITFRWKDDARRLEIDTRKGFYPGMLKERDFLLTLPGGESVRVHYSGKALSATL